MAFDHRNALGDVLGVIADPFDHTGDLQRSDDFAQIVRERRAQRDDPHRELFDFDLQRVDALVTRDDLARAFQVVTAQRFHRSRDGVLRQSAHLRDQPAQLANIFVEGFHRMIVQGHGPAFSRSGQ
ncbi:hypothetical protein D9M73_123430 [compost metagenome]